MITFVYHAYAVTNFIKHIYFKNISVIFQSKVKHSSIISMNLFEMYSFSLNNSTQCRPCCVHISDPCTCMAQVKLGEEYPKRCAHFLWVYYTIPFGFSCFRHFWGITFKLVKLHCLAWVHWWGFSTRNAHIVHIVYPIQNGVYILVEVSFKFQLLDVSHVSLRGHN